MPRLGDDQNMATAYPDRVSTNLRGSWLRKLAMTVVGTLLLYNVVFKDYKNQTKTGMSNRGIAGDIETIIPKTRAEKLKEALETKRTMAEKNEALHYQVGNLTNAVIELQELLVETNGVTIQHPVTLPEPEEGEGEDGGGGGGGGKNKAAEGVRASQDGDEGEDGDHPYAMLRGAETGHEDKYGGGTGDAAGKVKNSDGGGGAGGRRLSSPLAETKRDANGRRPAAGGGGSRSRQRLRRQQQHRSRREELSNLPGEGGPAR
ncbi:unnamed protein product [Ectocarpus sp. CCAP 1310/34]|nr:unnamed protein product [Ectocarpus sp. CCAP 1310/34]